MGEVLELIGQEAFITLIGILSTVAVSALAWISKKASDYIDEEVDNKYLQKILTQANEVVFDSVKAAMQEEVEDLKEKGDDNKLKKEDAERIKTRVVNRIISKMGDETLAELDNRFGDAQAFIEDKIEATINDIKRDKK